MKYDGTKDPQEHIIAFEARMNLEGAVDAVQCYAFPRTLFEPAIKWFNVLPHSLSDASLPCSEWYREISIEKP
ncbi:hypothetical protein AHAS_Ahas15G0124600 [Arachis hypogaea]